MADIQTVPIVPPLPEYEYHSGGRSTSEAGGSNTTKALSPEQLAASAKQDDLLAEQTKLADQRLVQTKAENQVKGEVAQQMSDAAGKLLGEREKAIDTSDKEISDWRTRIKAARAEYDAAPLPTLFGNKSDGQKVLFALGMGLSAVADARRTSALIMNGINPGNASAVDEIIKSDFDRQREHIAKLGERVVAAKAGVSDALEARKILLSDIDVKQASVYDRLEKLQRARLASLGQGAADIDRNEAVVNAQKQREEARMRSVEGLTQTIEARHSSTNEKSNEVINRVPGDTKAGGGVEADKNAANFNEFKEYALQLADAMKKLTPEEITDINAARAQQAAAQRSPTVNAVATTLGLDSESGLSPRAKAYLDAASRAEDAIGRLKSGGAINADESARFGQWLIPRPSDQPRDIAMRGVNIKKDVETFGKYMDRPAKPPVSPAAPAAAPTSAKKEETPTPPRGETPTQARPKVIVVKGKRYVDKGNGDYQPEGAP